MDVVWTKTRQWGITHQQPLQSTYRDEIYQNSYTAMPKYLEVDEDILSLLHGCWIVYNCTVGTLIISWIMSCHSEVKW